MRCQTRLLQVALPVLAMTLTGCGVADLLGPASHDDASRAVERWASRHSDGWTVTSATAKPLARAEWSSPCSQDPDSGFTVLRYRSAATDVLLGFRCPLAGSSAADLEAAFAWAVLDVLPHGISVSGWEFRVITPSSHVSEGVAISSPVPGRLRIDIETALYAVYGHSRSGSCQPPADAPSPEGCDVHREHRVPLRLTLSAPFSGSALE